MIGINKESSKRLPYPSTDGTSRGTYPANNDVLGAQPRVTGRRISVLQLYELVERRGMDPKTVTGKYDLDVADVYHALAYYHDNVAEMAKVRQRRREAIEENRDSALTPDDLDSTDEK
jgi:uncharacterized protein (DUF433 family)